MKITLPTAEEVRNQSAKITTSKEASARRIAETFLNGAVKEAIRLASAEPNRRGVNVEIPVEAYSCTDDFYAICIEELTAPPLGFKAEKSHDGGGMYSTLYVSWEKPKKK